MADLTMKPWLVIAVTAFAGMLVGTLLGGMIPRAKTQSAASVGDSTDVHALALSLRKTAEQVKDLEGRMTSEAKATVPSSLAPQPERERARTPQERELARKVIFERWGNSLQYHRQQQVNPAFSVQAASAFNKNLDKISDELGFAVVGTDCRSQSCEVTVEWPNFDLARKNFRRVTELPESMNCSHDVVLPEPENPDTPYVQHVLFDNCKFIPPEQGRGI